MLKTFEELYDKKDYSNAIQKLQEHASELPPGLLHYNLGTVHFKMENWAQARYHFLMARETGISLPELTKNREAVETKLEIDRLEKPINASDFLIKGSLLAKEGIFTSISLIFLLIGLVTLKKNASLKKVLLWLLVVMMPVGLSLWTSTWSRSIVTGTQIISEGPSAIFSTSGELPSGVMVIVRDQGDWKKIIYPSRFNGWVKATGLKKLE